LGTVNFLQVKITSKGRVTIPLAIRRKLRLKPGTKVEFVAEGERVVLKRCEEDVVEAWLKSATGVAKRRTTTGKIMKLTRGE
jgi:AbrB family looped-hinge helix DNA binding protein